MSIFEVLRAARWLILSQVATVGLMAVSAGHTHASELRFLYASGEVAPGTLEDGVFYNFGDAGFDANGRIVFQASLLGARFNSLNDTGIWGMQNGQTTLLIQEGRNLELGKSVFLSNHRVTGITDAGELVISAETQGDEATGYAILFADSTGVATPAMYLRPVAGQTPNTLFGGAEAQTSAAGQIYGRVQLIGEDVNSLNDDTIWTSDNGAPGELFAREGEPAAGLSSPPATWSTFNYLTVNRDGMIAARTRLIDGVTIESEYNTLLAYTPQGGWKRAVSLLDPVPNSNSQFGELFVPALNENGTLAFYGFTGEPSEGGIFTYDELHGVQRLVQAGTYVDEADGTLQFVQLNSSRQHPHLLFDDHDRVLFEGQLFNAQTTLDNNQALWSADAAGVRALLREGDPVYDREGSWVLGGGPGGTFEFDGSLNASGWAAIGSPVYNPATGDIGPGLWSISPTGAIETIVAAGDQLEVSSGDTRTLQWVSVMAGNDRSGFRPVDANGSVVLYVAFADGSSGLMLYTVPEPSYAVASLIAFAAMWSWKRSIRL